MQTSPDDSNPTVLITGGLGCIGVTTTQWLLKHYDCQIVILSRKADQASVEQEFPESNGRVNAVAADVRSVQDLQAVLDERQITHVAHMAGLQTPDCNANRDMGLQINLAGTQNLIEAIKQSNLAVQRVVFASSVAVYGPRDSYPAGQVPMLSDPSPVNVYGVWKLAGEHVSRLFHEETGVPTINIRPGALFGPGRDRGLTATPTTAMKHLAVGKPYEIPYRSKQDYLYAHDVGAAVANTLLEPFEGYASFTLPGHTADSATFVRLIQELASELEIEDPGITHGQDEVPFICELDFEPFCKAFPKAALTPLKEAIRQSILVFQEQSAKGMLHLS
ncbi:MAG: NAD(P)-dependent oxidoreductase [Planctomycetota bacterium]